MDKCTLCIENFDHNQTIQTYEHFVLIYPLKPKSKYHFILTPLRHINHFHELDHNESIEQTRIMRNLQTCLATIKHYEGYNLLSNNGTRFAGQSVLHYHLHIFPRFKDETVRALDVLAKKADQPVFTPQEWLINRKKLTKLTDNVYVYE